MYNSMNLEEIKKLCAQTLVWDAHAGVFPNHEIDLTLLNEWRKNSVNYVSINVGFDVMSMNQTLETLAAYRNWVLKNNDLFVLACNMSDVVTAKKEGKLAVAFDIEGMNALNGNINMLSLYHGLGVRQMLFAYNLNNKAAGGCHDTDIGLSTFGKTIVKEMNRVGIIIDCSHAGLKTTMDIMAHSTKPVVFSHSNPKTICEHQRNITDDQIKACAKTGGVIGINGMGIFLGNNDINTHRIVRHICYISELVGSEHVGIGFDYSPQLDIDVSAILATRPDFWPPGQSYDTPDIKHAGPSQIVDIAAVLTGIGFKTNEVEGILGKNFQRVASIVWQ